MYQFLLNMWMMGRIDEDYLRLMVKKEFVTQVEMEMIVATPQLFK